MDPQTSASFDQVAGYIAELHVEQVRLKEAVIELTAQCFWVYNLSGFCTSDEARAQVVAFNERHRLVEDLQVVDMSDLDTIEPEDFA